MKIVLLLLLATSTFGQLSPEARLSDSIKLFKVKNTENFKKIFTSPDLRDKRTLWYSLTKDEKNEVRRANFAWGAAYLNLSGEQLDLLVTISKKLPVITKEEVSKFEKASTFLFDKRDGESLFGTIGPTSKFCYTPIRFQPSACACSVGSSFNVSCDGECVAGGTRCTVQSDGCGFLGFYRCDGLCQAG